MSENTTEQIKEKVKEFFLKAGFSVELKITKNDRTFKIDVQTDQPKELIGQKGTLLLEIQHLLNAILKKQIGQEIFIDLDVGGYKERKIKYLRELARAIADEVALTKKEKILEPMPAYERRIIHLELASRPDVTTESIGKEPNRKVVIKPYP